MKSELHISEGQPEKACKFLEGGSDGERLPCVRGTDHASGARRSWPNASSILSSFTSDIRRLHVKRFNVQRKV